MLFAVAGHQVDQPADFHPYVNCCPYIDLTCKDGNYTTDENRCAGLVTIHIDTITELPRLCSLFLRISAVVKRFRQPIQALYS